MDFSEDDNDVGGVIRCLCDLDEDDGFTIQCEGCQAWQHALCVNIDPVAVPDTYVCEECDPQPDAARSLIFNTDREWAAERQRIRRQAELDLRLNTGLQEGDILAQARAIAYSSLTTLPTNALQPGFQQDKRKKQRKSLSILDPRQVPFDQSQFPQEDLDDSFQGWQFEYTQVEQCIWHDTNALDSIKAALQAWFATKYHQAGSDDETEPLNATLSRPKYSVSYEVSRTGHVKWLRKRLKARKKSTPAATTEPPEFANYDVEQDAGFVSPVGPVEMSELPAKPPDNIKPILLVKPIPAASMSLAPPLSMPFSTSSSATPSLAIPYPRPTSHAVFATASIQPGSFIAPFTGQIESMTKYRSNPANQYKTLGMPKPCVRGMPAPWSIYIDSRQYGSEGRFIRSGCHPNAIIRPVVHSLKHVSKVADTFQVSFALFALCEISKREEIILPWDWDDSHLVHTLPALLELPTTLWTLEPSPDLSRKMAQVISTLFGMTVCACEKRKDCALGWLWKLACSSQPSGLGGNNRREVEDEEIVKERMVASLASGLAIKKGPRTKRPDLGPLMELRRGWLNRSDQNRDLLPKTQVKDKDILANVTQHVAGSDAGKDEQHLHPVNIDENTSMDVDTSLDVHQPLQSNALQEVEYAAQVQTQLQSGTSQDMPVQLQLNPAVAKEGIAILPEISIHTSPHQENWAESISRPQAEHTPTQISFSESATGSVEQATEPDPEPIVVTREKTPPPPRAKLSFAAFRKRLAEKKSESTTEGPVTANEKASEHAISAESHENKASAETTEMQIDTPSLIDDVTRPNQQVAVDSSSRRSTGDDAVGLLEQEARSTSRNISIARTDQEQSSVSFEHPSTFRQQPSSSSAYLPSASALYYNSQRTLNYRSPSPIVLGKANAVSSGDTLPDQQNAMTTEAPPSTMALSPMYKPASPIYEAHSPKYQAHSPTYEARSPRYEANSPVLGPSSPAARPVSPPSRSDSPPPRQYRSGRLRSRSVSPRPALRTASEAFLARSGPRQDQTSSPAFFSAPRGNYNRFARGGGANIRGRAAPKFAQSDAAREAYARNYYNSFQDQRRESTVQPRARPMEPSRSRDNDPPRGPKASQYRNETISDSSLSARQPVMGGAFPDRTYRQRSPDARPPARHEDSASSRYEESSASSRYEDNSTDRPRSHAPRPYPFIPRGYRGRGRGY